MKAKIKLLYLFMVFCSSGFGQANEFKYKRKISGITDQWHKLILPDDIFNKIKTDLSDIRIIGVTKSRDTIQVPYILKPGPGKSPEKEVAFNLINVSVNEKGFYFTLELPEETAVNNIELNFKQENFDWRIGLEGSGNGQAWFSLLQDYRVLSIKNKLTDFKFTKVLFPDSKYKYYRFFIDTDKRPELLSAKISLDENITAKSKKHVIRTIKITEDRKAGQTLIDVDLHAALSIAKLKIYVKDSFDYYRRATLNYVTDSVKTDMGWKYNFNLLTTGTLNSLKKNEFVVSSTILQKFNIIIDNEDNNPLHIDSVEVEGYEHELIARFNEQASFYLAYGNAFVTKPNYDIERFAAKIPDLPAELALGEEQLLSRSESSETDALFKNRGWLWMIMGVIILILGWFSLKMIRQNK